MSNKKLNLRELDFNNIGAWPQNAKIGLCVSSRPHHRLYGGVRARQAQETGGCAQETVERVFETRGRAANLDR